MTFAVSSPVGRSGKITVRAPTPEAALAWVGKLRFLIERRSLSRALQREFSYQKKN
jgi:hypothetical protein